MPLSGERYEKLVLALESLAKTSPVQYKIRLCFLACFACLLSVSPILLIFLSAIFLIWAYQICTGYWQISFALSSLSFALALGLLLLPLDFGPPPGIPVLESDCPELYRLLSEYTCLAEAPKFDGIYLNSEFNASIRSSSGSFCSARFKHFLCLGLPMMQCLSAPELQAVLAHEIGHLSRKHGFFNAWLYLLRRNLLEILKKTSKVKKLGAITLPYELLKQFCLIFNAHAFVLLRQHELEADRLASQIVGARELSFSLINCQLKSRFMDEVYWKELFRNAASCPEAPSSPFAMISEAMQNSSADGRVFTWYKQALKRKTSVHRSHPSLAERLSAIREQAAKEALEGEPCLPDFDKLSLADLKSNWKSEVTAAQFYLGQNLPAIALQMDFLWQKTYGQIWKQEHQKINQSNQKLISYEKQLKERELLPAELKEYAELCVRLRQPSQYIPVLVKSLTHYPEDPFLNYNMGESLLAEGDLSGVSYLEKVIQILPEKTPEISKLIYECFLDHGDHANASLYLRKHLDASGALGLDQAD